MRNNNYEEKNFTTWELQVSTTVQCNRTPPDEIKAGRTLHSLGGASNAALPATNKNVLLKPLCVGQHTSIHKSTVVGRGELSDKGRD